MICIRLLLMFSLAALMLTACEQTMHVFAEGGLNIREAPGESIIATIPPGHTVTVIEEGTEELEIGGRRGVWHRVRYGELEGYVFSAFLTEDEKLIAQLKMCEMVGGHYQSYPAIHYVEHHEGLIRYVSPEGDVLWQESTAEEIADRNIFCG